MGGGEPFGTDEWQIPFILLVPTPPIEGSIRVIRIYYHVDVDRINGGVGP